MTPPAIDHWRMQCMADCGYSLDPILGPVLGLAGLLSVGFALIYGLALAGRSPSLPRTIVKTSAVGGLLIAAGLWGSPPLLLGALFACAVGDAFLAGDPKRWLVPGLIAFLIGHVLYIFLFASHREAGMEPSGPQTAALAALAVAAVGMLAFLWKHLGALRPAVILYVVAISVMTGSSFLLDGYYWQAMAGSVAFMASDAVLAISLFREEKLFGSPRATDWAVWFLYYAAQFLLASSFIGFQ